MYLTRTKGFTLVELMTVVAVLAILTAIAFPSFISSMRSNRVATASNELLASLSLARSEAIRSRRGGGLCASSSGTACDGGGWNDGWLVWTDNQSKPGVMEAGEPVIRFVQAKQKMVVTGTATTISFDARGRSSSGLQTIGVKPESVSTPVRCITITATGQTKVKQAACT